MRVDGVSLVTQSKLEDTGAFSRIAWLKNVWMSVHARELRCKQAPPSLSDPCGMERLHWE